MTSWSSKRGALSLASRPALSAIAPLAVVFEPLTEFKARAVFEDEFAVRVGGVRIALHDARGECEVVLEDDVVELSQLHADRRVRPRQTGPQQASGPATSDALFYTPVRRGTGLCDVRQLAVGPLLTLIRVS